LLKGTLGKVKGTRLSFVKRHTWLWERHSIQDWLKALDSAKGHLVLEKAIGSALFKGTLDFGKDNQFKIG